MPTPSERSRRAYHSPIRLLARYSREAEKRGKKIYYLNIGQPDLETPVQGMKQLQGSLPEILSYGPSEGNTELREKFAMYYRDQNIPMASQDLLITAGGSEAILFAMEGCLDEGEKIIIPEPMYAIYRGYTQMAGLEVQAITSHIEDAFALPSIRDFEEKISANTKAILLCNPNNPTGSVYPQEVLQELAEIVKYHDLHLIVDEVYSVFTYDKPFFSALRLEGIEDHVIVIDSVSKRYSACGARIGLLISKNQALLRQITKFAEYRLSPPRLAQQLVTGFLDLPDSYYRNVKSTFEKRRDYLFGRLSKMEGVKAYCPGGAFYVFAELPVDNAELFCRWLLTDFDYEGSTVMLAPGAGFYATPGLGEREVRIAYVLSVEKLTSALDCLEHALRVYPGKITEPLLTSKVS